MKNQTLEFPNMVLLERYWKEAKKQFDDHENIIEVKYPKSLCRVSNNSQERWANCAAEIKEINSETFNDISRIAGVYAIFKRKTSKDVWQIKYIGQTTKQFSRQRLINHLIEKHKNTGAKLEHVKSAVESGNQVGFSFLPIDPPEMRHYVEEKLISEYKDTLEWNQRSKK